MQLKMNIWESRSQFASSLLPQSSLLPPAGSSRCSHNTLLSRFCWAMTIVTEAGWHHNLGIIDTQHVHTQGQTWHVVWKLCHHFNLCRQHGVMESSLDANLWSVFRLIMKWWALLESKSNVYRMQYVLAESFKRTFIPEQIWWLETQSRLFQRLQAF